MPEPAFATGDIIDGKYRIERSLGGGGMGYVLGAWHLQLGGRVALKFLHRDAAQDDRAVLRLFHEARAASRIKGDHVARVQDVGTLGDGTPYLVMEYLDGCDLAQLLEQSGVLPVALAVDYVLQACEALAEAHAVGIVHRDVKPSNLFLTKRRDGSACVKVLDFGISKAMAAVDAHKPDFGLTQTQSLLGSPKYMAPEQMRPSKPVDARTDVWAIGTVLYEVLTGHPPFDATSMAEVFAMILTDPAPSLHGARNDVPPALDQVFQRCVEKDPDKRFGSVLDLARALAPFASDPRGDAVVRIERVVQSAAQDASALRGSSPSLGEAIPARTLVDSNKTSAPRRTLRHAFAAVALLGLAGSALAFAFVLRPRRVAPAPLVAEPAATVETAVDARPEPAPPTTMTTEPTVSEPAAPPSAIVSARPKTLPAPATPPRPPHLKPEPPPPPPKPATTATSRYD